MSSEEEAKIPDRFEVGGRSVQLHRPGSISVQYEIVYSAATNEQRAFAAALGACWDRLGKRVQYRYDPLPYGGRVIEHLLEHGWTYPEIIQAGQIAFAYLARDIISASEVEEAEGFSEAATAPST